MTNQFELFKKDKPEKEPKKLRWDKRETFWIGRVRSTKKEHKCEKCEEVIPPNKPAEITVDVENGKPDFTKTKYWHPNEKCPKLMGRKETEEYRKQRLEEDLKETNK